MYTHNLFLMHNTPWLNGPSLRASLGVRVCQGPPGNRGVNDIRALAVPRFPLQMPLSQDQNCD